MHFMNEIYDCIIIGGGPAGLNAAVVLGRCNRKVLLFDTEKYRNRWSHGMHNYLTRDGILPPDFISECHKELRKYSVQKTKKKITKAAKNKKGIFVAKDADGRSYQSKKMLVATGLIDTLPNVEGFDEMYGKSVHHCPYCDGWEVSDKILGVYAKEKEGWELALNLKSWSKNVTLYTDGGNTLKPRHKKQLIANDIKIVELPIKKLFGKKGLLEKIIFKNEEEMACDSMFFVNGYDQHCNIAETFGCKMTKKGVVATNHFQQTNIPGLYVAGDASKDMHFVVVAAAEGAKAGVLINKELQKEISDAKTKEAKTASPS